MVTLKPGDIGFFTKFSSDPNNILKGHIYVLVDLDMNITDVSTSCITYFGDIEKILNEEDGVKYIVKQKKITYLYFITYK